MQLATETPHQRDARELRVLRLVFRGYDVFRDGIDWCARLRRPVTVRMRAAGVVKVVRRVSAAALDETLTEQSVLIILDRRNDRPD
ncbi:hypothetical protein ACFLIM_09105 [Nonomuraea sp. M3C6]|uniref:Uncharacterized protein n=1 Tax=Nonomuraea marmarensis TaxID=3351344 RepID=A0ABW7A7P0_9ACTN